MIVNTRNGLFANAGYGGGTFNGNVAFGSYDSQEEQAHHYVDLSNLNAPYDNLTSLQGLGSDAVPASIAITSQDFPWMEESAPTRQVQIETNAKLRRDGFNTLLEDGVLGPRTCGALNHYGDLLKVAGACDSRRSEFMQPVRASLVSSVVPAVLVEEEGGAPIWVWALLAGGAAVGAAIYMKKKKR